MNPLFLAPMKTLSTTKLISILVDTNSSGDLLNQLNAQRPSSKFSFATPSPPTYYGDISNDINTLHSMFAEYPPNIPNNPAMEIKILNFVSGSGVNFPILASTYGLLQEARQTTSYKGRTNFVAHLCDGVAIMSTIDMMERGHVVEIKNRINGYTGMTEREEIQIMMYMWITGATTHAIHRQYYLGIPRDTIVHWNPSAFKNIVARFHYIYCRYINVPTLFDKETKERLLNKQKCLERMRIEVASYRRS